MDDAASAALYSVKLDGSDLQRVSPSDLDPTIEEVIPRFSPDGKTMVFLRDGRIDGVVKYAIFKSRPDGSHAQQMTPWDLNADRPSVSPARSGPTAGLVAFETYGGGMPGRGDIALIPLGCKSVEGCMASIRYVTHNYPGPKSAYAASWSPGGRFVSFAEETVFGRPDVWTSAWDGSLRHQLTHDVTSFSPSWGQ
jgi:Tol biopolymer transport system component